MRNVGPIALLVATSFGSLSITHASPDAGNSPVHATLREGDFAYTVEEGQRCSSELMMVRDQQRDIDDARAGSQPPGNRLAILRAYRALLESCVEQVRQTDAAAAGRTRAKTEKARAARAQEEKNAQEMAARAEHEAKIQAAAQAVTENPKAAQSILSAMLCHDLSDRSRAMGAIAKEKKYSAIGGVIDLSRRAELQDEVASIDDHVGRIRDSLRAAKRTPISCKNAAVAALTSCLAADVDERPPGCGGAEATVLLEAANILQSQM